MDTRLPQADRWRLAARVSRIIAIPLAVVAFVWVGLLAFYAAIIVVFPGRNDASFAEGVVFLLIFLPGALTPALLLFAAKYDYDTERYRRSFFLGLPSVVLALAVWWIIFAGVGSLLENSP